VADTIDLKREENQRREKLPCGVALVSPFKETEHGIKGGNSELLKRGEMLLTDSLEPTSCLRSKVTELNESVLVMCRNGAARPRC
jgi:hypothetical protein